jgi:hypothetical protein
MPTNNLAQRFLTYQSERFPFLTHGLLISAFSFSAYAYARLCRQLPVEVKWSIFLPGIFITITLFFLLRIFDEHKDALEDAQHRTHLPVPRGLISLSELRNIGFVTVVLQAIVLLTCFPRMIWLYALVIGYMLLMWKEFFIPEWLKKRPFWYVTSHMVIIPLVDIFASGLDWFIAHSPPPAGLLYFFLVSFMNGIVLEVGRKIRTPETEEVNTYSTQMGMHKATWLWLTALCVTLICSFLAARSAYLHSLTYMLLIVVFALCAAIGLLFLLKPTAKKAKWIEYASGIWTLCMYLLLGGLAAFMR